jgi:hypothetical protein
MVGVYEPLPLFLLPLFLLFLYLKEELLSENIRMGTSAAARAAPASLRACSGLSEGKEKKEDEDERLA